MNKDKLPVKYLISIWKTLPGYPTREDVLFEVHQYISKKTSDEFSEQTLNGIWYDTGGVANWRGTMYETRINEMMSDGTFEKTRTEEKTGKDWFKIAKPESWM